MKIMDQWMLHSFFMMQKSVQLRGENVQQREKPDGGRGSWH